MKHGPSTMLIALPSHNTRIAIAASPAPRKTALIKKSRTTVAFPPRSTRVNPLPVDTTASVAPITRSRLAP